MNKNKLLLFFLLIQRLVACEVLITWNTDAKKTFKNWQKIEQMLKKNSMPLAEKLEKITSHPLQLKIDYTPAIRGCYFKILSAGESQENGICLSFTAWYDDKKLEIKNITIGEPYRKQGLGRCCINIFDNKKLAELVGYNDIALQSVPSAKGFYSRLGFICAEKNKSCLNFYSYSKQV